MGNMKTKTTNEKGQFTGKFYLQQDEIKEHLRVYADKLREHGYTEDQIEDRLASYYTNRIIKKYSKKEQDAILNYWINMILKVKDGYWLAQELIQQPHQVYDHYKCKRYMSYEKGNVTPHTLERERIKGNEPKGLSDKPKGL